jgi:hypothetical protein
VSAHTDAKPIRNLRHGLRKHGQARLPVRKADSKRRNLRASLHQFPEFRDCKVESRLPFGGGFVRGGGCVRSW